MPPQYTIFGVAGGYQIWGPQRNRDNKKPFSSEKGTIQIGLADIQLNLPFDGMELPL